jgi:hypothetical protein
MLSTNATNLTAKHYPERWNSWQLLTRHKWHVNACWCRNHRNSVLSFGTFMKVSAWDWAGRRRPAHRSPHQPIGCCNASAQLSALDCCFVLTTSARSFCLSSWPRGCRQQPQVLSCTLVRGDAWGRLCGLVGCERRMAAAVLSDPASRKSDYWIGEFVVGRLSACRSVGWFGSVGIVSCLGLLTVSPHCRRTPCMSCAGGVSFNHRQRERTVKQFVN